MLIIKIAVNALLKNTFKPIEFLLQTEPMRWPGLTVCGIASRFCDDVFRVGDDGSGLHLELDLDQGVIIIFFCFGSGYLQIHFKLINFSDVRVGQVGNEWCIIVILGIAVCWDINS